MQGRILRACPIFFLHQSAQKEKRRKGSARVPWNHPLKWAAMSQSNSWFMKRSWWETPASWVCPGQTNCYEVWNQYLSQQERWKWFVLRFFFFNLVKFFLVTVHKSCKHMYIFPHQNCHAFRNLTCSSSLGKPRGKMCKVTPYSIRRLWQGNVMNLRATRCTWWVLK